jgi:glycosyltransferase involved in cell wall biosynthesis
VIHNKVIVDHLINQIVKFYASVDEVWIPQAYVEETLRRYGYKGRIEVVKNGVDFEAVKDIDSFRKESRVLEGINSNEIVFLFVGQHIWEKNLKFLVDSLSRIRNFKYKMLFVGEGYAKQNIENLIASYGLNYRVTFLGAIHDRDRLKRLYASADLFLFPSLYDNAPLVIREAASMHTPSLLLKDSTAAEVIRDGVNGYLSDNDTKQFIQKIQNIFIKRDELKTIGQNAAQTLYHPWSNIVDEVASRYENLYKRTSSNSKTKSFTFFKNPVISQNYKAKIK